MNKPTLGRSMVFVMVGLAVIVIIGYFKSEQKTYHIYAQYQNQIGTNYTILRNGYGDCKLVCTNLKYGQKEELKATLFKATSQRATLNFKVQDTTGNMIDCSIEMPLSTDTIYHAYVVNDYKRTFSLYTIVSPADSKPGFIKEEWLQESQK